MGPALHRGSLPAVTRPRTSHPSDARRSALERGRAAYQARSWNDAFQLLSDADQESPLEREDLERLAWSAVLSGYDQPMLSAEERAYEAHVAAGDAPRAARAAFWLGFRLLGLGERGRASAWLGRAREQVEREQGDCVERGYLLLPEIYMRLGANDPEAALAAAGEAMRIADRCGDADLSAMARNLKGMVLIRMVRVQEGLALFDDAMLTATSRELTPIVTGLIYCNVVDWCQRVYALDRAREWTLALSDWCEAQPQLVTFSGNCRAQRAAVLQLHGDWAEAIDEARVASERARMSADTAASGPAHYQRAEVHRLRGEYREAEEAYREASLARCDPQPGLALLRLAQGQVETAANAVRTALDASTDPWRRARLLPAWVEIATAAGDLEAARGGVEELEATAERTDVEVLGAMAAHARGTLRLLEGDTRGALAPLREAVEVWERVGAPYIAARIRVLIGNACRTQGDRDGADLEFAAARGVFEALGAAPDLALLEPPNPAGSGRPAGLTPRELEVLRLVATGMTNKAIARQLFLSEKTIDRHVSNIFTKLDVASRAAATAYAYEHHLV